MHLELMYITNKEEIAKIADENGVDRIFVDLEINGKEERQGHLNTVISRHSIEDVKKIKKVIKNSNLLVRVNPIFERSDIEINRVINDGADIVMLPMWKTVDEVRTFIELVDGEARVCLLLETREAVECIDEVLKLKGIDEIHIGLNDLHLSYNLNFMFELLSDGTVEMLCEKFKKFGIKYGFGGVSKIGDGILPAEKILIEHYRLESSMVILSRGFCNTNVELNENNMRKIENTFFNEIRNIKEYYLNIRKDNEKFLKNKQEIKSIVDKISFIKKENGENL